MQEHEIATALGGGFPVNRPNGDIIALGKQFRGVGAGTPTSFARKAELLLGAPPNGERLAFVLADVLRCSTTITGLLAAGASGVVISSKGGSEGVSEAVAQRLAHKNRLELVNDGELHGRPIAGGQVGNSPRRIPSELNRNTLVRFQSTNFGKLFSDATRIVNNLTESGALVDTYVGCLRNARRICEDVRGGNYDRIVVGTAGFYDVVSLEDVVFAGEIFAGSGLSVRDLDDEARVMYYAAKGLGDGEERLSAMQTDWIGRALEAYNLHLDVPAAVDGDGIPVELDRRMQAMVPMVFWAGGTPVICSRTTVDKLKTIET